jgi:hypothetical protein
VKRLARIWLAASALFLAVLVRGDRPEANAHPFVRNGMRAGY